VVRKSSAEQEAAPFTTSWPRIIRASFFNLLRLDLLEFLSQEASRVLTGPDSQSNPMLEASNRNVTPKTYPLRPSRAMLPSHLPPLRVSLMSESIRKQKELPTMPNIRDEHDTRLVPNPYRIDGTDFFPSMKRVSWYRTERVSGTETGTDTRYQEIGTYPVLPLFC
nr:hypothetical protein [Tanacetum cinerariifolium]